MTPTSLGAQHLVVYVTGRAGVAGSYVYSTIEAAIAANPLVFNTNDCSGSGQMVTVPSVATSAEIILYGAQGGAASGLLGNGDTGGGGAGDDVTLYPPIRVGQGDVWTVDPGSAGAHGDFNLVSSGYGGAGGGCSGSMVLSGGDGGTQGGVATYNGGGGGGASSVCFGTVPQCTATSEAQNGICTSGYASTPCVMGIAGGGGGQGGDALLGGVGGYGGFWLNGGTYAGNGGAGSNLLGIGSAAGGLAGGRPRRTTRARRCSPTPPAAWAWRAR